MLPPETVESVAEEPWMTFLFHDVWPSIDPMGAEEIRSRDRSRVMNKARTVGRWIKGMYGVVDTVRAPELAPSRASCRMRGTLS